VEVGVEVGGDGDIVSFSSSASASASAPASAYAHTFSAYAHTFSAPVLGGTGTGADRGTDTCNEIGNGDRAVCVFRFLYHPEYIVLGEAMLFRELRTVGVGTVSRLL
jgi:hypothetical protein